MFARKPHGLLDAFAAVLCLWAAAYHTPVGALGRTLTARLLGRQTSARPMLAYYSGGVWEAARSGSPLAVPELSDPEQLATVPAGPAMGRAVFSTYLRATPERRREGAALSVRYHLGPALLDDPSTGPEAATQVVDLARGELGSEDAAVLAFFAGYDTAKYAAERTRAEGNPLQLQFLATRVAPGSADAVDAASQALSLGTAFGLSWPVEKNTRVTSPFGWRENPVTGRRQLHTGVDLGVPEGTLVHATFAGVVTRASYDALNGNLVTIDHGRGVATAYCHNSALRVRVGQQVEEGQVVAESGTTGRSTGPHVHYQLELSHRPVDPLLFKASGQAHWAARGVPELLTPTPTPVKGAAPRGSGVSLAPRNALERAAVLQAGAHDQPPGQGATDAIE